MNRKVDFSQQESKKKTSVNFLSCTINSTLLKRVIQCTLLHNACTLHYRSSFNDFNGKYEQIGKYLLFC